MFSIFSFSWNSTRWNWKPELFLHMNFVFESSRYYFRIWMTDKRLWANHRQIYSRLRPIAWNSDLFEKLLHKLVTCQIINQVIFQLFFFQLLLLFLRISTISTGLSTAQHIDFYGSATHRQLSNTKLIPNTNRKIFLFFLFSHFICQDSQYLGAFNGGNPGGNSYAKFGIVLLLI